MSGRPRHIGYSIRALDAPLLIQMYSRVYRRRAVRSLLHVMSAFQLRKAEAGLIFQVSGRTIDAWLAKGVPAARSADVERVASLVRNLEQRFKRDRLPQIVRASVVGLDGYSILKAIQTQGTVRVSEMLERAFSYLPG